MLVLRHHIESPQASQQLAIPPDFALLSRRRREMCLDTSNAVCNPESRILLYMLFWGREMSADNINNLRQLINCLDDNILPLFLDRLSLITQVGLNKSPSAPSIRAGREADVMLRLRDMVLQRTSDRSAVLTAWNSVYALYRSILTNSVLLQSNGLQVVAHTVLYDAANKHFAGQVPIKTEFQIAETIASARENKLTVAVVPANHVVSLALAEQSEHDKVYVIGRIPLSKAGQWAWMLAQQLPDKSELCPNVTVVSAEICGGDTPVKDLSIARRQVRNISLDEASGTRYGFARVPKHILPGNESGIPRSDGLASIRVLGGYPLGPSPHNLPKLAQA